MKKLLTSMFILMNISILRSADNVYVLNTLSENLSIINLQSGEVNTDAITVGNPETADYPNEIIINNNHVYVVNSGINEIQMINIENLATTRRIDTGVGSNPYSIEFIDDQTLAVSLLFTNEVVLVNVLDGSEKARIPVETGPEGLLYNNGKLYVSNTNFKSLGAYGTGTISVIDIGTESVIKTIPVGKNPQKIKQDGEGHIIVLCTGDYESIFSSLYRIDTNSDAVIDSILLLDNAFVSNFYMSQDDHAILTAYGLAMVYDLQSGIYVRDLEHALKGGPGITIDKNGNVYITDFAQDSIYVYSSDYTLIQSYLVGDGPISVAVHPDIQSDIIMESKSNKISGLMLYPNFPNPFNPGTSISYQLPRTTHVNLAVFDTRGYKIAELVNEIQHTGYYRTFWDAGNVSSGVYFYRLLTNNGHLITKKMIYLR